MGDDYSGVKNPASPYANKNSNVTPTPQPPEITFRFHVLSSVADPKVAEKIQIWMTWVKALWTPRADESKKETVKFTLDPDIRKIDDKAKAYRRIDFRNSGAPQLIALVKGNYSNSTLAAEIPVFVCEVAWVESQDKGDPHDGELQGYTLLPTEQGYEGERAILLLSQAFSSKALAHELTHWIDSGSTHSKYANDASNLAHSGGGGPTLDADQYHKMFRWATDVKYRTRLAAKIAK